MQRSDRGIDEGKWKTIARQDFSKSRARVFAREKQRETAGYGPVVNEPSLRRPASIPAQLIALAAFAAASRPIRTRTRYRLPVDYRGGASNRALDANRSDSSRVLSRESTKSHYVSLGRSTIDPADSRIRALPL
jgi:hypothetical protein